MHKNELICQKCAINFGIGGNASNENITKYKNLGVVKSISNSVQRLARYRIVDLISIGRLCGSIHLRVKIAFRVKILTPNFDSFFRAKISDSKFWVKISSQNFDSKNSESKFRVKIPSQNSESKFRVKIPSQNSESKFQVKILSNQPELNRSGNV